MQGAAGARRSLNEDAVKPIVAAARECFARVGIQRTRMEDIARGAGISRQAVYRYVSGREDLVELAIMERCREFADELIAGTASDPPDVVDAMVDLILRAISAARVDEEFAYLAEAAPRVRLNLLLSSASSPVHAMVGECFAALFEKATEQRLLRDDITRREMVEWLQSVLTAFVPRADLDVSETRRYVREFALRSLLRPG
jgi:AcrR family transcriptional regulator